MTSQSLHHHWWSQSCLHCYTSYGRCLLSLSRHHRWMISYFEYIRESNVNNTHNLLLLHKCCFICGCKHAIKHALCVPLSVLGSVAAICLLCKYVLSRVLEHSYWGQLCFRSSLSAAWMVHRAEPMLKARSNILSRRESLDRRRPFRKARHRSNRG